MQAPGAGGWGHLVSLAVSNSKPYVLVPIGLSASSNSGVEVSSLMTAMTEELNTPAGSVITAENRTTPPTISSGVGVVIVIVGPSLSTLNTSRISTCWPIAFV